MVLYLYVNCTKQKMSNLIPRHHIYCCVLMIIVTGLRMQTKDFLLIRYAESLPFQCYTPRRLNLEIQAIEAVKAHVSLLAASCA